ncbi:MAG: thermonuclease family protein [Methanothrix sp.]|nr:thermonuclease family protein [Methanothrix sp.]
MKWILALLLTIAIIKSVAGAPDEVIGRVVSVISGDSLGIEMKTSDPRVNHIDSVKLADIEAPSTLTPVGKDARKYADSILKNKTVSLDIDDNKSGGRNEWNQLLCVIYLMTSDNRLIWPPVNRIMVDSGHAVLNDDKSNEFNASTWWKDPTVSLESKAKSKPKNLVSAPPASPEKDLSSTNVLEKDPHSTSVLEKNPTSGGVNIRYR